MDGGVISPGGVGYDINCGVRLATTGLKRQDIADDVARLVNMLHARIPAGVGSRGGIHLKKREFASLVREGASWAIKKGMGEPSDLDKIEDGGALYGADPETISDRAFNRGKDQLGTLGSGNILLRSVMWTRSSMWTQLSGGDWRQEL